MWAISVVGGKLRKLRDDAWLATPSPDGSLIAFVSPDYRELWVMNANGEDARRLIAIDTGATFLQVVWAPDGQHLAYLKNYSLQPERVIESCDLKGGQIRRIWSDPRLKNFCWTPRGPIIATLRESDAGSSAGRAHSDLWEVSVRNGQAAGAPRRLTNFAGFTPLSLSVTADAKHLALIRSYDQSDVYVGVLGARGESLKEPRRLTLDDRIDWPGGWTRDSKAVLFYSDRQGTLDIFRQPVEDRTADVLVTDAEEKRQPQLSPDGSWILYLSWRAMLAGAVPAAGRVMRIPVAGGPPQAVCEVKGYPGSAQVPREIGTRVLTSGGHPDLRCPAAPGTRCFLTEREANKVVFYKFDPIRGDKTEVARADVDGSSSWDVSTDGSKIALAELSRSSRIRILTTADAGAREVPIQGFRMIASVGWSADGASLFVTGTVPEGGSALRHVSLDGRSQLLYQADVWLERPIPSPDGRHLAFGQATSSNNVWTVENFERR
jgi:hypothetical protein